MYGLPADFDPSVMVGTFLSKIGFGRSSLHLDLDWPVGTEDRECLSFVIVGHYSYSIEGKSFEGNASQPQTGAALLTLLNEDVTEARIIGRGDLFVGLGAGNHIQLREDDSGFESYTIHIPNQLEIVV